KSVTGNNPSYSTGDDNLPVERVSWWDAIKFCNGLSRSEGLLECYNESTGACDFAKNGFRLPTDAEWEYACRAGSTTMYNLGNAESDLARAGWYISNSEHRTHAVGGKAPNAWGLYDMHGNVTEWCNDWFQWYTSVTETNPIGALTGSSRVWRGFCFLYPPDLVQSACRDCSFPVDKDFDVGFRVVRRVSPQNY
ncbi:MAG: formylglycine-generating enzyme family protein, partial [Candidatus Latescibacterota bacterium]